MKSEIITNEFSKKYPDIAAWVEDSTIEIGRQPWGGSRAFIVVHDEGGTVWEGKHKYASLDEALQDAEQAIAKWFEENIPTKL